MIRIPLSDVDYKNNTEYFVELNAVTKQKWGLLPKGFEVAHEQIPLDAKYKKTEIGIDYGSNLNIETSTETITVFNGIVSLTFNKEKGRLNVLYLQRK